MSTPSRARRVKTAFAKFLGRSPGSPDASDDAASTSTSSSFGPTFERQEAEDYYDFTRMSRDRSPSPSPLPRTNLPEIVTILVEKEPQPPILAIHDPELNVSYMNNDLGVSTRSTPSFELAPPQSRTTPPPHTPRPLPSAPARSSPPSAIPQSSSSSLSASWIPSPLPSAMSPSSRQSRIRALPIPPSPAGPRLPSSMPRSSRALPATPIRSSLPATSSSQILSFSTASLGLAPPPTLVIPSRSFSLPTNSLFPVDDNNFMDSPVFHPTTPRLPRTRSKLPQKQRSFYGDCGGVESSKSPIDWDALEEILRFSYDGVAEYV